MVTRGFDPYLVSRVERAQGDHHYFDIQNLRFFDAYGGASFRLPHSLDPDRLFTALVESVRGPYQMRRYRPTVVLFTKDTQRGGEKVSIFHPFWVDAMSASVTRGVALRAVQRYVRDVTHEVRNGGEIHRAAHGIA